MGLGTLRRYYVEPVKPVAEVEKEPKKKPAPKKKSTPKKAEPKEVTKDVE